MLKTESVEINGTEYQTTQFPALHSLEVLATLVRVAGPVLAVLGAANQEAELSTITPQLMQAMHGMKPSDARDLVLSLLSNTNAMVRSANGQMRLVLLNSQSSVDSVFSGKIKDMFAVVGHAIRVNYGDFIGGSDPSAPLTQTASDE